MTGHFGPPLEKLKSAAFSSCLDEVSKSPRDEKSPNESSSSNAKRQRQKKKPSKAIATSSEADGKCVGLVRSVVMVR